MVNEWLGPRLPSGWSLSKLLTKSSTDKGQNLEIKKQQRILDFWCKYQGLLNVYVYGNMATKRQANSDGHWNQILVNS